MEIVLINVIEKNERLEKEKNEMRKIIENLSNFSTNFWDFIFVICFFKKYFSKKTLKKI